MLMSDNMVFEKSQLRERQENAVFDSMLKLSACAANLGPWHTGLVIATSKNQGGNNGIIDFRTCHTK